MNKISPPALGKVVMRERLFELFTQPHPSSAFWVAGPGGSGKTTLVASYLNQNNIPCLWYQVDHLDQDPATFFYYLGQAAAPMLAPGRPPLPLLTPEYLPDIKTFIVRYFEKLYQDLQSPCWIVFDNFHEAPNDSLIQQIASTAIEMLPQNISIAIISRNDPSPTMARLRANQSLLVIDWNKISFTAEETNELINLHHCSSDDKETDRLHRFTQGWAAGIILWLLPLERNPDISNLPKDLSLENIFDYFAGEILDKTKPEVIDFFLKTSLFPYMTPDMANKLTGMESMELLEDLNRRNCFLEKRLLLETSYQYHPLFREFLLSRSTRHFTPESLNNLKIRAAEILTDKNFVEEAIDLYNEAKEYKPLIKLLLSQAPVLISQGRHQRLTTRIELLPTELAENNPWLLFWHGLALLPSHPLKGQECCIRAYELFTQLDDLPGRIYSWSTIIETFLILRAVITPVDDWIKEGEKLETLMSDKLDINLVSRFTGSMFAALVLRNPGHPKILKWQSQCEKFLQQCTDEQILAVLSTNLTISYFWFGQIHKSKMMLASLQPPDPACVSPVIILGYHTIKSLLLLSQGNWTQC